MDSSSNDDAPPWSSICNMSEISCCCGPVPPAPWGCGWVAAVEEGGPSGVPGPCHWPHIPENKKKQIQTKTQWKAL